MTASGLRARTGAPSRARAALVVLRVVTGLVFLTNGLSKATGVRQIDLGFFRGSLIDLPVARSILLGSARRATLPLLPQLYEWIGGAGWPVFAVLLTIAELAAGIGLLLGVLVRWAAIGCLLLLAPIWVMRWPTGGYLWEYPADLLPLVVLVIAPAPGRLWARVRSMRRSR